MRGDAVTDLTLKLSFDGRTIDVRLAALSEFAERLPKVRDGLLSFFDSGEQLFRLDGDRGSATIAGECVVRPYPSDALIGLLTALGAGDSDLLLVEHGASPEVEFRHRSTTSHPLQSGGCP